MNLKESIRRILREETNEYLFFRRRISNIEKKLSEEMEYLDCERCNSGYGLFRDVVLIQVNVSLRNDEYPNKFDRNLLKDFILDNYEPTIKNKYDSVCEKCK